MSILTFFISISSLVFFPYLLLIKKLPLLHVSLITLLIVLGQTFFYWQIIPSVIFISSAKGLFLALDIFLIIFGAIFFLEILKSLNVIDCLTYYLESFSKDYRIQVILLAWFFENFIEGTAGFGTPAAIVAPLLVSLGLSPLKAVVISLIGNSSAVVFGAAGTPISIGFAALATSSLPIYAAAINLLGFLVPVYMIFSLKNHPLEVLPFAIISGLLFVIPSFLTTPLGQEFPSILGSVFGLILIIILIRFHLFIPKTIRRLHPLQKPQRLLSRFATTYPYGLLILLLFISKLILSSAKINLPAINHAISLFNPGLAFLLAGFLTTFTHQKLPLLVPALTNSLRRAIEPFLIIAAMSGMVQLMANSGQNFSNLPSLLEIISRSLQSLNLVFFTPFIGAFGAFLTGSATLSNLMFGQLLSQTAQLQHLNLSLILALQVVGASAGNMIALADILAAETIVGLRHQENSLLKSLIIPCGIYVLLVSLLGLIISSCHFSSFSRF